MRSIIITAGVLLFCFAPCLLADGLYGDFTGDNIVNLKDLFEFGNLWLSQDSNQIAGIDLNDDHIINFYEFSVFADNWMLHIPSAPTGLSATAGNAKVLLDWNNNTESDLAGYNIYRSITSGSGYAKINTSLRTLSDYNDTGVTNGTTYYYVVRAVDTASNESDNSSEVSAAPSGPPPVTAPQNLMVPPQAFDDSSITLIWSKPSNYSTVARYNVYKDGSLLGNTTKLFYNVTGLTAATSYSFTVKSVDSNSIELAVSNTISQSTSPAMQVFNVTSYGAVGNGTTLNTTAIQNTINACTPGGKVLIPSGTFKSGAIFLKSNMTLQIDGTLMGSASAADYPTMPMRFEGTETTCYSALINVGNTRYHTYGGQISHVTICGSGTVNGNGSGSTGLIASEGGITSMRGRLIYMVNASYVNLQGLTLTNPPAWTIHPVYSTQITIQGITANTVGISNGDGCDPDSSTYIYFFNDTFNTGDDCIAIKSGKNLEGYNINMPSAYIRVTNCIFNQGHGGVTIGSESSGGVNNVFAQDCVVIGNQIGLRMKTCPARGGTVEYITIKDWTITGATKFGINIITNYSDSGGTPAPTLPICRNITVENVTVDSTSAMGFDIEGQSSIHITDMLFKHCAFNKNTQNKLIYVDRATFTGCTIVGGFSQSNCTNIIQN